MSNVPKSKRKLSDLEFYSNRAMDKFYDSLFVQQ